MLKTLLIVRAAFNLLFGIVLLVWMEHEVLRGLGRGGLYLLVDGALTLAIAVALMGQRSSLAAVTAADGLLRLGAGAFIVANPGLEQMVMTTTFFLVLVSIGFVTLGIVGLAITWFGARKSATGAPAWPPAAISLSTLLLGVGIALSFFDQQLRQIVAVYAVAVGLLLGFTVWRMQPAAPSGSSAGVAG